MFGFVGSNEFQAKKQFYPKKLHNGIKSIKTLNPVNAMFCIYKFFYVYSQMNNVKKLFTNKNSSALKILEVNKKNCSCLISIIYITKNRIWTLLVRSKERPQSTISTLLHYAQFSVNFIEQSAQSHFGKQNSHIIIKWTHR